MKLLYYERAIKDILENRFLNAVTIITIALSILISSAFTLFFINASDIMSSWKKGIRIMAYLKPGIAPAQLPDLKLRLKSISGVQEAVFISKDEALDRLKGQMKRQVSLFENLKGNPLPDAFEIRMVPISEKGEDVELLATRIESLKMIEEVEYGQKWFGRFTDVMNLFRLTGYALGVLFFMAAVFIVANTIRIVLYSRRQEIEIMRLVGATDTFIKSPLYIEGLILGALGGLIGLSVLFVVFVFISSNFQQNLSFGLFQARFLTMEMTLGILVGSMFVGWLGCYLSLKQFLKV